MGFAFAFLMPMGAILIRAARLRNLVWYHAAIMIFAYALALVGLGLGVYIAIVPESQVFKLPLDLVISRRSCSLTVFKSQIVASNGHPIIGILVVGLLLLQPPLGIIHHYIFKRKQTRTIWSTVHVWWGRALVTVAIINGGLGLQLSGDIVKGEIAYGVIAGVIWLTWMVVSTSSYFGSGDIRAGQGEKNGNQQYDGHDFSHKDVSNGVRA